VAEQAGNLNDSAGSCVGPADDQAQSYAALVARLERFQTLTRVNRLISSSLDLNAVLLEIARAAAGLMGAAVASFWLADEAEQWLELRAFSDEALGEDQTFRRTRFGEGSAGWVAFHRREMSADDAFSDGRVGGLAWYKRHGLRTVFTVPVMLERRVLAVLSLNGREPFRFSKADRELLDSFVGQAAVAIQNARLYTRLADAVRDTERANQAKSAALSRISHELRTPLNAIVGFAQILELTLERPADLEAVNYINQAGLHLLELVNQVLDISSLQAGQFNVRLEPVEAGALLRQLATLLEPLARQYAVSTRIEVPEPVWVLGDQQRLRQVLFNLLSNAIKYNRRGGTVTMTCPAYADGRVRVSVRDTGPGIPPEQVERLFDPFDRLGAEASNVEGTGLGLPIARLLAEAMGGRLGVSSMPDWGSTFWVEVPTTPPPVVRDGSGC
jgi:signal transduction histidine kinase